jgi:hypothetical protein
LIHLRSTIMEKPRFNYKDNIQTISSYFSISEAAAKYIFHRRRRGIPYKKEGSSNYLEWSMQLQNALINADQLASFDWNVLKFDDDLKTLMQNGIDVNSQPKTVQVNKIKQTQNLRLSLKCNDGRDIEEDDDTEGWTVVTSSKTQLVKKQVLRKMGLLPHTKPVYKYNKNYVAKVALI